MVMVSDYDDDAQNDAKAVLFSATKRLLVCYGHIREGR